MSKQIIVYTSKGCTRCRILKQWLWRNKLQFVTKSLDDTEVMADLVMRNLFVLSSPVLETEDRFWLLHEIFLPNNRLNPVLKRFLRCDLTE